MITSITITGTSCSKMIFTALTTYNFKEDEYAIIILMKVKKSKFTV